MKKLLSILLFIISCGGTILVPEQIQEEDPRIAEMQARIDALQGTVAQINALVLSDFASCSGPDANDALVKKMCEVAHASTVEAQVALKGELATFAQQLQSQINNINLDVSAASALEASDIASINSQITTINSTLTTLTTQMTSANSAITALQTLTNSINVTLQGTTTSLEVGSENVSAGPLYESVLKRVDGTKYIAYVTAYGSNLATGSNPFNVANGNATVTVTTSAAHGLIVGDVVLFSGATTGRGFNLAQINISQTVVTVPLTTTFTINMTTLSTSAGTFGGAAVITKKYLGAGLGNIWVSGDGTDVAVRVTTLGSKPYNFIMVQDGASKGHLCYDKVLNTQTFSNLTNAACQTLGVATGNCSCK